MSSGALARLFSIVARHAEPVRVAVARNSLHSHVTTPSKSLSPTTTMMMQLSLWRNLELIDSRSYVAPPTSVYWKHPHCRSSVTCRLYGTTFPSSKQDRMFSTMRYTRTHEYVKLEQGNTHVDVTLGLSAHAAEELGELVYVELPSPGDEVSPNRTIVTVESVKSAADVFCPIPGVVKEVNPALNENPKLINDDPEGNGWVIKITSQFPSVQVLLNEQSENLLDSAAYKAMLEAES